MKRVVGLVILGLTLVACSGQGGGVAPSPETPPAAPVPIVSAPVVDVTSGSSLKNGQIVNSTNGWSIALDTTDPVEYLTLANGWNVEVKYEF